MAAMRFVGFGLAGHAKSSTTDVYMHLSPRSLRSAIELLDDEGELEEMEPAWNAFQVDWFPVWFQTLSTPCDHRRHHHAPSPREPAPTW